MFVDMAPELELDTALVWDMDMVMDKALDMDMAHICSG
jgi:hypothetical protein